MKTSQWIRPFLFTLLVLIGPVLAYYLYFVEVRESFLLERLHAHLANSASRTESRFQSVFDVIANNPNNDNEFGVQWDRSESCRWAGREGESPTSGAVGRLARGRICFAYDEPSALAPAAGSGAPAASVKTALVSADALVGDVDPEHLFSDVLLLDQDARVVFQRDAQLGRVPRGDRFVATRAADPDPATPKTLDDPLDEMRVTYQGRPFLVFVQPVTASSSGNVTWTLVGLLEQPAFSALKYDVHASGLVLVVCLLVTLLLAGPFLKLWYLGPFEPLTRFDLFLQTGAGLSLVAMATVFLLGWGTFTHLSGHFNQRLADVSQALAEALEHEHRQAVKVLDELEPMMVAAYRRRLQSAGEEPEQASADCPTIAAPGTTAAASLEELGVLEGRILTWTRLAPRALRETSAFTQMKMAYLMDQHGCQIVKWSSERAWTKPGRFFDRAYFQRAAAGDSSPHGLHRLDGATAAFFHDVIISRTTGERSVVFSKPVNGCRPPAAGSGARPAHPWPCVSVVSAHARVFDAVLPSGYGALLLDRNGSILLRTGAGLSTESNLADEIDQRERLLSMLARGWPDEPFYADYRRDVHRFHVQPLHLDGLTLVTYYGRSLVTSPVLETVGAAVTAWLLWVSLLVTGFFALWILDDMTDRRLRRQAAYFGVAMILLGVLGLPALAVSPVLLVSLAGVPLSLLALRFVSREGSFQLDPGFRRSAVVGITWLAVMLAAALPMYVFYDSARQQMLDALVRFQNTEYLHARRQQQMRLEDWLVRVDLQEGAAVAEDDEQALWPNHAFLGTPPLDAPLKLRDCGLNVVCMLLQQLPDYSPRIVGLHAMYRLNRESGDPPASGVALSRWPAATLAEGMQTVGWVVFLLVVPAGIWYLLVRTLGMRTENVLDVCSFTPPRLDQDSLHMIHGAPQHLRRALYFDALEHEPRLWVDLRDVPPDAQLAVPADTRAVVLDHFDANLCDLDVLRQRVVLLEQLLRAQHPVILLLISVEPLNYVTSLYDPEQHGTLLARFASVLARFQFTYHHSSDPDETGAPRRPPPGFWPRLRYLLEDHQRAGDWRRTLVTSECHHPDLWPIRDRLLQEPQLQRWSKPQIVQQVNSRANALYQQMWYQCTRTEKFTLMELARGNPVNPNNWDAARRLKVRGYVTSEPFYRIGSESLRLFVQRMERIENVDSWRAQNPGTWTQIKVPLLLMVITVLVFVAVTQPNLFNSIFAFGAAGAASFPLLISALNARLQRAARE